jgi:hypothetical protein
LLARKFILSEPCRNFRQNPAKRWPSNIQMRAVRGIGQAMEAQREAGLMAKGTRGNSQEVLSGGSDLEPPDEPEEPKPITLAEAGIDKHLADRAGREKRRQD